MKRFLLIMLAAVMSTAMFAQQEKPFDKGPLVTTKSLMRTAQKGEIISNKSDVVKKGIARSAETGLYYYKPEGSMYETDYIISSQGLGYYPNTYLTVPAWQNFTFENMSDNPSSTVWWVDDINYSETYPSNIDSNGNLTLSTIPGGGYYGYYTPYLKNTSGTESYAMGDADNYLGVVEGSFQIGYLGFLDFKQPYGLWADNTYISGSQKVTYNDEEWTTSELVQTYPAPASPLYVEDVKMLVVTKSTLLSNGKELTMEIYENNGEYLWDDAYERGDLKETLTATIDDFEEAYTVDGLTFGFLRFSKKVVDPIFSVMEEPIIIDYPMTIYIEDMDDPDVDFGTTAYDMYDCDNVKEISGVTLNCYKGDDKMSIGYSNPLGIVLMFDGMMDKVMVADEIVWGDGYDDTGYSILQISDDGKTCDNYGMEDSYYNLGAVFAETAREWYDEDDNENYSYIVSQTTDEENDWITTVYADTEDYSYYNGYYANYISFETEQLPDGMEGRSAVLYLTGAGYTDSQPVIIIQGDAEVPSGINSVLAYPEQAAKTKYAGTYNLAGQRVSDSTKGLVVKDGKKVLVK